MHLNLSAYDHSIITVHITASQVILHFFNKQIYTLKSYSEVYLHPPIYMVQPIISITITG